jgi:hypothetical protein
MTWLSLTRITGETVCMNMDKVLEFAAAPQITTHMMITTIRAGIEGGPLNIVVTESPESMAKRLSIHGGKSPE